METALAAPTGAYDLFESEPAGLIGIPVRPDDDCPSCGEGIAVIQAAKEPHAGSLVCAACGKHRGWLPRRVHDFITATIKQFGRSSEPIAFRRGLTSPEGTHMNFDNSNKGVLFNNAGAKKSESDPDYSGSIDVAGAEYWLKGWIKTSKKNVKFLSLSVRPKEAKQPAKAVPFDDEVPF